METLKDKGCTIDLIPISDPTKNISFNIKRVNFGDLDRIEYVIPKSYLFLNQTLEYIVISENNDLLLNKKIIKGGLFNSRLKVYKSV